MAQARVSRDLFRQHGMSEHLIVDPVEAVIGSIVSKHGAEEAGAPTQRTVTSASAIVGTIAWSMKTNAIMNQASLLAPAFICVIVPFSQTQ